MSDYDRVAKAIDYIVRRVGNHPTLNEIGSKHEGQIFLRTLLHKESPAPHASAKSKIFEA